MIDFSGSPGLLRFSPIIASSLPRNNPWFGSFFMCFPPSIFFFFFCLIKLPKYHKLLQNRKIWKWSAQYPIRKIFSYFSYYDLFNKHDFNIGFTRTRGNATIIVHAKTKKLQELRLKSTQILFNKEYRLKVNGTVLFSWKPSKTRSVNFIGCHLENPVLSPNLKANCFYQDGGVLLNMCVYRCCICNRSIHKIQNPHNSQIFMK